MKTVQKQSAATTAAQPKTGRPFFQKSGEEAMAMPERETFFTAGKNAPGNASRPFVQTKLTIGQPGDKYEQEADHVADQVVQRLAQPEAITPNPTAEKPIPPKLQLKAAPAPAASQSSATPSVQTKCAECEQEEKEQLEGAEALPAVQKKPIFESEANNGALQMKCAACEAEEETLQPKSDGAEAPAASPSLESRLQSSKGGGSPLPENTRSQMEGAIGTDFSGVRVHTNSSAVQMNKELGAQAFTHGSDVYFNAGKYDTGSTEGQRLLGHELVHTVQQGGGAIQNKRIQKQPTVNQQPPLITLKPTNPISINTSTSNFSGNIDSKSFQSPDEYLPFDVSLNIWERYMLEASSSINSFGQREVSQKINSPTKSASGKDLENEISFLTQVKGKGASGSIETDTELKALYDFKSYEWVPYDEGIRIDKPSTFGRKAYPVEVFYRQTVQYSDTKGRQVTIEIFGKVHYTPERWEDAIGLRIGKIPPMELLIMNGNFGFYSWKLYGKGPLQHYYYEHIFGNDSQPNLIDLARVQNPQMHRDKPLPFPNFVAPYVLPGSQFHQISAYLDAADKIETDYRNWLDSLPKWKGGGGGNSIIDNGNVTDTDSDSGWTMPTWLAGVLTGIGIIIGTVAVVLLAAEVIVGAAAIFGISLTFGAVVKAIAVIGLGASFVRALYHRISEAMQNGYVSPMALMGAVLLDTFGISLFIEAVTDKSILTGKPLNRSTFQRWMMGTIGAVSTIMSFLGLRNMMGGKTPTTNPATSAPATAGATAAALRANVLKNNLSINPTQLAQIQQVESQLAAITGTAIQNVNNGTATGRWALLLARTPQTSPVYRMRLGNAIHEEAFALIQGEIAAGNLPSGIVTNAGRSIPQNGLPNSFVPFRPDIRMPLGGGREAVFDITTIGQAGHAAPYGTRPNVEYVSEILY